MAGTITTDSGTGTITTKTGARSITNLGNSTTSGTLTIGTNTYGTVNIWGSSGSGTVQVANHTATVSGTTVTNSSGSLLTASLNPSSGSVQDSSSSGEIYLTSSSSGAAGLKVSACGAISVDSSGWVNSSTYNSCDGKIWSDTMIRYIREIDVASGQTYGTSSWPGLYIYGSAYAYCNGSTYLINSSNVSGISPSNIKSGVNILGTIGTLVGGNSNSFYLQKFTSSNNGYGLEGYDCIGNIPDAIDALNCDNSTQLYMYIYTINNMVCGTISGTFQQDGTYGNGSCYLKWIGPTYAPDYYQNDYSQSFTSSRNLTIKGNRSNIHLEITTDGYLRLFSNSSGTTNSFKATFSYSKTSF